MSTFYLAILVILMSVMTPAHCVSCYVSGVPVTDQIVGSCSTILLDSVTVQTSLWLNLTLLSNNSTALSITLRSSTIPSGGGGNYFLAIGGFLSEPAESVGPAIVTIEGVQGNVALAIGGYFPANSVIRIVNCNFQAYKVEIPFVTGPFRGLVLAPIAGKNSVFEFVNSTMKETSNPAAILISTGLPAGSNIVTLAENVTIAFRNVSFFCQGKLLSLDQLALSKGGQFIMSRCTTTNLQNNVFDITTVSLASGSAWILEDSTFITTSNSVFSSTSDNPWTFDSGSSWTIRRTFITGTGGQSISLMNFGGDLTFNNQSSWIIDNVTITQTQGNCLSMASITLNRTSQLLFTDVNFVCLQSIMVTTKLAVDRRSSCTLVRTFAKSTQATYINTNFNGVIVTGFSLFSWSDSVVSVNVGGNGKSILFDNSIVISNNSAMYWRNVVIVAYLQALVVQPSITIANHSSIIWERCNITSTASTSNAVTLTTASFLISGHSAFVVQQSTLASGDAYALSIASTSVVEKSSWILLRDNAISTTKYEGNILRLTSSPTVGVTDATSNISIISNNFSYYSPASYAFESWNAGSGFLFFRCNFIGGAEAAAVAASARVAISGPLFVGSTCASACSKLQQCFIPNVDPAALNTVPSPCDDCGCATGMGNASCISFLGNDLPYEDVTEPPARAASRTRGSSSPSMATSESQSASYSFSLTYSPQPASSTMTISEFLSASYTGNGISNSMLHSSTVSQSAWASATLSTTVSLTMSGSRAVTGSIVTLSLSMSITKTVRGIVTPSQIVSISYSPQPASSTMTISEFLSASYTGNGISNSMLHSSTVSQSAWASATLSTTVSLTMSGSRAVTGSIVSLSLSMSITKTVRGIVTPSQIVSILRSYSHSRNSSKSFTTSASVSRSSTQSAHVTLSVTPSPTKTPVETASVSAFDVSLTSINSVSRSGTIPVGSMTRDPSLSKSHRSSTATHVLWPTHSAYNDNITNTNTPPLVVPAPTLTDVAAVAQATTKSVTVVSAITSSPTSAVSMSRLTAMQAVLSCELQFDVNDAVNLISLTFGPNDGEQARGAITGNLLIVVICGVLLIFAISMAVLLRRRVVHKRALEIESEHDVEKKKKLMHTWTFTKTMTMFHCPGAIAIPMAAILQPTLASSVALFYVDEWAGDIPLAIFGMLVCVGFAVWVVKVVMWKFPCTLLPHPKYQSRLESVTTRGGVRLVLFKLLGAHDHWTYSANPAWRKQHSLMFEDCPNTVVCCIRYDCICCDRHRDRASKDVHKNLHHAGCIFLCHVRCACGCVVVVPASTKICIMQAAFFFVTYVVLVAALLWFQPMLQRAMTIFCLIMNGLGLVAASALLLYAIDKDTFPGGADVVSTCALVMSVFALMKTISDIFEIILGVRAKLVKVTMYYVNGRKHPPSLREGASVLQVHTTLQEEIFLHEDEVSTLPHHLLNSAPVADDVSEEDDSPFDGSDDTASDVSDGAVLSFLAPSATSLSEKNRPSVVVPVGDDILLHDPFADDDNDERSENGNRSASPVEMRAYLPPINTLMLSHLASSPTRPPAALPSSRHGTKHFFLGSDTVSRGREDLLMAYESLLHENE
ncbi:membrane-associated protein, putative [Bodo saltans]|uniref:Membrane-associated protein, putative n=1 Tax=Bodo saltans TaxID=75058 RepID=A0A0S4J0G7_BODSA|nr:membrane-associated protein, putative [Bodo saltans]|eukprot:CUG06348.1 membrane-associated protein, putative [Bodo saltans]